MLLRARSAIGQNRTEAAYLETIMPRLFGDSSAPTDQPPPATARARPAAQGWDAMLAEFRALGGTAENVTLRHGRRGRGLFPVDPAKPVRLCVPPNLLVPYEHIELRDGRLVVKASAALAERERAFFDRYQRDFSWGAGVFDDLWQEQLAWSRLPQELQATLTKIGPVDGTRFSEPSEDLCFRRYLATRQILYGEVPVVMPMVELVNHGANAAPYDCGDGIAVGGVFDDEVLVNYGADDCWGMALQYGFCDQRPHAYSLRLQFDFQDCRIQISRVLVEVKSFNGFPLPIVRVADGTVHFSFLMLGNKGFPRVPRAVFLHVTKKTPVKRPDELFDFIQHLNRIQFLDFLRVSEDPATPLAAMLHRAAYQQLAALSEYYGTRSLAAGPA